MGTTQSRRRDTVAIAARRNQHGGTTCKGGQDVTFVEAAQRAPHFEESVCMLPGYKVPLHDETMSI